MSLGLKIDDIENQGKNKPAKPTAKRPRKNTQATKKIVQKKYEAPKTKEEKIAEAKDPEKKLEQVDKQLKQIELKTEKMLAQAEKIEAQKEQKEDDLNKTVETEDKKTNRGRKKVDKTPTWTRYYTMRRIPRSILDILKKRLAYDVGLDGFTVTIKGSELLSELKKDYPKITNTTINTSFYRLKNAGWFEEVSSYTGPDSDRTVKIDPTLIMTPSEIKEISQYH